MNPCPTCPAGFVYLTSNGTLAAQRRRRCSCAAACATASPPSAQYTLAKATDNAAAFGGASARRRVRIAQDWLDLDAEHAPSNFDQRHQVTAQVQYTTGAGITGGTLRGRLARDVC